MSKARHKILRRLLVVRGMPAPEASAYLGLGETNFHEMVNDGRMPRPRIADGKRLWDVEELDSAFRELPREGAEVEDDSWADCRAARQQLALRRPQKAKAHIQEPSSSKRPNAYSVRMLAQRWVCSKTHIYHMVRSGRIKAFKFGTLHRISADEVARIEAEGAPAVIEKLAANAGANWKPWMSNRRE